MAGAHLTRSQWTMTKNWNPGAVIDKFRRGREVVRDKGVTTEGKRVLGSPISVTDWASGLQCMVPSPRGCQDFRAGHSEVCELWARTQRGSLETLPAAFEPQDARRQLLPRSTSTLPRATTVAVRSAKSSSMTTQVGARGRLCFCADD